ncbi:MAG: hypothetical protein HYR97_00085 [Candidatus Melainabacteria bacterium]|nr:hypothetical protein [Candidatus Melainabacteria bacterium]
MKNLPLLLKDKNLVKKVFFSLLVLLIAFELAQFSVNVNAIFHFGIVSLIFVVVVSYIFWKQSIFFLMIWIVFAGVIRKWILPQMSDVVFFFGHFILTGIYIRYFYQKFTTRDSLIIKHPINKFLFVMLVWSLICAINPQLKSVIVSVLGLVIYFYYVPIIYILPQVINSKEQLIHYLKVFSVISVVPLTLGIIQFLSPYDSSINQYVGGELEALAFVGEYVRVSSTFSYISGYASYLNILVLIVVYLLSLRILSVKFTVFLNVVFMLGMINLFMTGSRGPFYHTLISIVVYLALAGFINRKFILKYLPRLIAVVALSFGVINFTYIGKEAFVSFSSRGQEDIPMRISRTFTTPFTHIKDIGIYGYGLGSTYQGVANILGEQYFKEEITTTIEDEPFRIMWETGLFGFIIAYVLRFLLMFYFWLMMKRLKDPTFRPLALMCILFQTQFFFGLASLIFNHTTSLIYWFLIGFLFLFPKLDMKNIGYAKT